MMHWTREGLYCEAGDFYIDPHRGVSRAVITHAHSDHARRGSLNYFCESSGVGLLKARLGPKIQVEPHVYGKKFKLGDAWLSFHPAGHILGSAQVRVEHQGKVWVVSGDYKREPDPTCPPFEPVACDVFVTEATFGTPAFRWSKNRELGREMHDWIQSHASRGMNCLLFGYSLGKAQRILAELKPHYTKPVYVHSSIIPLSQCYRDEGVALCETIPLEEAPHELQGELILAPPSILDGEFRQKLAPYVTAFASGWMQGGGGFRFRSYDHGFVISDHADWDDLNQTIQETGARRIYVAHRGSGVLVRHLRSQGFEAHPLEDLKPLPQLELDI